MLLDEIVGKCCRIQHLMRVIAVACSAALHLTSTKLELFHMPLITPLDTPSTPLRFP